jgi:hypothetical protein
MVRQDRSSPFLILGIIIFWEVPKLSYNKLTASDPALITFLNTLAPDWAETQTIPPTDLSAIPLSLTTIQVNWTPISYTQDAGHYQVKFSSTDGGPYTNAPSTTSDKTSSSYAMTNLMPNTTYYFVVETVTLSHTNNHNTLTSTLSNQVSATTPIAVSFVYLPLLFK